MTENDQNEETGMTDDSELPEKKGLQALLKNKKLLIGIIAVIVVVLAAGGFLVMKSRKKAPKDDKKSAETEKTEEKTAADYFDHIAVLGPIEIEISDSGEPAGDAKPESGEKTPAESVDGKKEEAEKKPNASVSGEIAKEGEGGEGEAVEEEVKTLRISIAFELSDPKVAKEIKSKASMIENDITEMISERKISELTSEEGKILLKNQFIANLNKTLESGKVRDIYFTVYLII